MNAVLLSQIRRPASERVRMPGSANGEARPDLELRRALREPHPDPNPDASEEGAAEAR